MNNKTIDELVKNITIDPKLYDKAEKRYKILSDFLNRDDSAIKKYNPKIYPQGSVRTGTLIKPENNSAYDVDLVCELLNLNKTNISPKKLKEIIGNEIKIYIKENGIQKEIQESKRCWTIEYSDGVSFHIDILPAIPDESGFLMELREQKIENENYSETAIAITDNKIKGYDKKPYVWKYSNPKGFSKWLKDIENNYRVLHERSIENMPEYKIPTPLKKIIMLIKKHRDIYFEKNEDNKPASIILTTLIGLVYDEYNNKNPDNLWATLKDIVYNMEKNISKNEEGELVIKNPTNEMENFADKWNLNYKLKEYFEDWIEQLGTDISSITQFSCFLLGKDTNKLRKEIKKEEKEHLSQQKHKEKDRWQNNDYQLCEINAYYTNTRIKINNFVNKDTKIDFFMKTNIKEPYQTFWRVINSGNAAFRKSDLRGFFEETTNNKNPLKKTENAGYKGIHSIECYIIKNNQIVEKSEPFIVRITWPKKLK